MRFYQCKHQFYCGVDLHARTMQVCILDAEALSSWSVGLPALVKHFSR